MIMSAQISFKDNVWEDNAPPIINANESHMACLFLLDTSGSMGDKRKDGIVPIEELNKAINRFKTQVCKSEKDVANMLDVAIVAFNDNINIIQDFCPITHMQESNHLTANGGTYMVPAIEKAIEMIHDRVYIYKETGAEPYKPWIVMISDGEPLDDIGNIAAKLTDLSEKNRLAFWSLSLPGANNQVLHELSGKRVLNLIGYNFEGFFDWVNKSMRVFSQSSPGEKVKLPPENDSIKLDIQDLS